MKVSLTPHLSPTEPNIQLQTHSKNSIPTWQKIAAVSAAVALPALAMFHYLYSHSSKPVSSPLCADIGNREIKDLCDYANQSAPGSDGTWNALGEAYVKISRYNEAYESFARAVENGSRGALLRIQGLRSGGYLPGFEMKIDELSNAYYAKAYSKLNG